MHLSASVGASELRLNDLAPSYCPTWMNLIGVPPQSPRMCVRRQLPDPIVLFNVNAVAFRCEFWQRHSFACVNTNEAGAVLVMFALPGLQGGSIEKADRVAAWMTTSAHDRRDD